MLDKIYKTHNALVDDIAHVAAHDIFGLECCAIIARYADAKKLLEIFLNSGIGICSVELVPPDFNNYEDAYLIYFLDDEIVCEPMYSEDFDRYVRAEFEIVYLFDDCNSKIIKSILADEIINVTIGEVKENYATQAEVDEVLEAIKDCMRDYCDKMDELNEYYATLHSLKRKL